MGTTSEVRGAARVRARLLPKDGDVPMWVRPKDAALGTRIECRPVGPDHAWREGILVAVVGAVWWIEVRA